MLIDTINSAIEAIENKKDAEERKKNNDAYLDAITKLDAASKTLETSLDCISLLQSKGISPSAIMSSSTKTDLLLAINNCGRSVDDGSLSREIVKVLETQAKTVKSEMDSAWVQNASQYAEGTKGYLSMIASLTENPAEAKKLVSDIETTAGKNSPTKNLINNLVEYVEQAKTITASFSINKKIETFLSKVSKGTATLADVTPDVQKWLKEKKLMGKLKVKF